MKWNLLCWAYGTTPKAVYSLLADDVVLRSQVRWEKVHFFWGDERHVGPDHPDSNFRMAWDSMLSRLPIDPSHVWRIKGEYPSASDAAQECERDLQTVFGLHEDQVPDLDLILLGMGPDGHTASLFPGTEALEEQRRLAVATRVEKLQTDRIVWLVDAPAARLLSSVTSMHDRNGRDAGSAIRNV